MKKYVFLFLALSLLSACDDKHEDIQIPAELVLKEGATVNADSGENRLSIIAGKGLDRTYQWSDCSLESNMRPRPSRWFGSAGIYDAAGRMILILAAGCNGVSRTVVDEGQLHFRDIVAANAFIMEIRSRLPKHNYAVSRDGLFLEWGFVPSRSQLSASLQQICIRGKKPENLMITEGEFIAVIPENGRVECVSVPDAVFDETLVQWKEHWDSVDKYNRDIKKTGSP